ncbi:DUF6879 family protein [Streptomyces sp. NPDC001985]|uniref:DUF6879 family protein n=1 Tax=Streptomyces sp. NPDC001985 TaxID=3154406 RepID=UPI00331890A2
MARRLRMLGTTSREGKCPTLYEDLDTGEIIVQGRTVTDTSSLSGAVDVLRHESFVAVPRDLLTRFTPRSDRPRGGVEFIADETFGSYFESFKHTAWRFESRRGYASDRDSQEYQRWLASGDVEANPSSPWYANIERQVALGKRIGRVRVVDSPLTEEQRYLTAAATVDGAAGEDIRHLWRPDAQRLQLPGEDFWLFDSRYALVLHFDDADEYLGAELVEDPVVIARFCQIRDAAWHHAVKHTDFLHQL